MSDDSQGLFSTVLGFLSREVQDFVTTATGGSTIDKVVASTNPRHRPKSKSRRTVQHPRREVLHVNDQEERGEEEWPKQQHALQRSSSRIRPPRGTSYSPTPSPRCGTSQNLRRSLSPLPRKLSSRVPPHRRRETSPPPRPHSPSPDDRPSFDGHSDDTGVRSEKEEERTEKSFPRLLRRQPSFTMPGSLFPRSPSMVPEPSPAAELHVHFPTQPTYFDYEVPVSGPSSSPDRMRPPGLIPRRSRAESMGETYGRRTQEGENDRLMVSRPSWSEKGKQRATDDFLESEASSPARAVLTGRSDGAASDVELDLAGANTSGEIRVRGKERELSVMLEERRAREVWWEAEAETTVIREEKTEYEDKIKKLEEEVKRLREELARRPTMAPIDNSYWYSMPPPPPPPPPPPLVLPRIPMTPAAAEVSFSDIRAHLRHTGTPVEAPINAPSTAKRIGQPTIGVPADKMASFLKEMKTVRLRKVINAPADMGRPLPVAASAETSFVGAGIQRPPRPVGDPVAIGEKRKREVDVQAQAQVQVQEGVQSVKRRLMGPLPRSADSSFRSVNSSFSTQTLSQSQPQSQSQSQGQKQPEVGPSNPSRSYIPVRAWPSSSVDGTDVTPSLTSDGDAEQGPDEPLPPTPPRAPAVVVNEPEDSEVEALPPPPPATKKRTPIPLPPTPPRRSRGLSAQSVFDKRPPRSPLPAPTPRKTRPLIRAAARRRITEESDDEDDPLASALLDSPLSAQSRRERRSGTAGVGAGSGAGLSRRVRKGNAPSTQKPSTQSNGDAPAGKVGRRYTLDEELRNSDGVTEDDLRTFDIEPHVYTAVGSNGGRKGFLAHGGGGGVPVFMGGAERDEDEEDEVEIIEPPSPPPPPPRKSRGRAAAGARR